MENLDFSLAENSPAEGYGCRVFGRMNRVIESENKVSVFEEIISRDVYEFSGEISENTYWEADTVIVTGDIVINENVVLEIAEGTRIEFEDYYEINVLGRIQAEGSFEEQIIFTSVYPEEFGINSSHRGCWHGIRFPYTSALMDSSIFEYCIFEYSKATGDNTKAGGVISCMNFSKLKIENCIFRNNVSDRGGALAFRQLSAPLVVNNLFHDNYCLEVASVLYNEYSYPILVNNTLSANHSINEDMWIISSTITNYFSKPKLSNNIIWGNTTEYFLLDEVFEPREYYYGINQIDQEELNPENIYIAPEFGENFCLAESSAGIDAGCDEYEYLLPENDIMGNDRISSEIVDIGCIEFQVTDSESNEIAAAAESLRIYPNPFNPLAVIRFNAENTGSAVFEIFDIKGRKVYFCKCELTAGENFLIWDGKTSEGKSAGSGIYLFKVKYNDGIKTGRGCLLK